MMEDIVASKFEYQEPACMNLKVINSLGVVPNASSSGKMRNKFYLCGGIAWHLKTHKSFVPVYLVLQAASMQQSLHSF